MITLVLATAYERTLALLHEVFDGEPGIALLPGGQTSPYLESSRARMRENPNPPPCPP